MDDLKKAAKLVDTKERIVFGLKKARNDDKDECGNAQLWSREDEIILAQESASLSELINEERRIKIECGLFTPLGHPVK